MAFGQGLWSPQRDRTKELQIGPVYIASELGVRIREERGLGTLQTNTWWIPTYEQHGRRERALLLASCNSP